MKKALIVYHKVDYDGVFSAVVCKRKLESSGYEVSTLGWTYGDDIPDVLGIKADSVFLVDISFPPEIMQELSKVPEVYWIDHHIGAITNSINGGYQNMAGLRVQGIGACEACWKFMYGNSEPIPWVIELASAYDVWDKSRFNWKNQSLALQQGLRVEYGVNLEKIYPVFEKLMNPKTIKGILKVGQVINQYNANRHKSAVKSYGFPVTINGNWKGICMLTTEFNSTIYESVLQDYQIYVCANRKIDQNGNVIYSISMYSESDTGLNLAEYMKANYNGGGHLCAAGGTMTEEQFMRLITEGQV